MEGTPQIPVVLDAKGVQVPEVRVINKQSNKTASGSQQSAAQSTRSISWHALAHSSYGHPGTSVQDSGTCMIFKMRFIVC
uniref:Uncharacterized protein n=1 Tax=Steinernema glaseri TaxID=37863 RepID=A0A1I7ZC61_9BILA